MSQPGITDLFGTGATFTGGNLTIPLTALQNAGITGDSPTALEIYAALVKNAHGWINTNTDASVMATSDLTSTAPITRNGTPRTQFQFAVRFFGSYSAPTFDPNSI